MNSGSICSTCATSIRGAPSPSQASLVSIANTLSTESVVLIERQDPHHYSRSRQTLWSGDQSASAEAIVPPRRPTRTKAIVWSPERSLGRHHVKRESDRHRDAR
jgi:hypothetical protein